MKKHTTITLSKEDCNALLKTYSILSVIEGVTKSGSYWTTNDILAIVNTARKEGLPTGLNAMSENSNANNMITFETED